MPSITLDDQTYPFEAGENLLDGLHARGVCVPSSCRSGVCQSCLLRVVSGTVPEAAQRPLRAPQRAQGLILACCTKVEGDLGLERAGDAGRAWRSQVLSKQVLDARTVIVRLAVPEGFSYHAGQFINLSRGKGAVRSYSLASVPSLEDYLELHIARMPGGQLSSWAYDHAQPGDEVQFTGPVGDCFYVPGTAEQPLFLFGTGTGLAPLYGILRDALSQGHTGTIHLFHGSPTEAGLYLHDALRGLEAEYASVHYHPCTLDAPNRPDISQGDMTKLSLARCGDLDGYRVYLCGAPEIVRTMQRACFLAGADMKNIYADAFLPAAR